MPTEGETSHNADAWDPCAQDPEGVPDWLLDSVFTGMRIKLRYRRNPSHMDLEFLGIDNGLVKVRDGMQRKTVPVSDLQAIPPTQNGDPVISFAMGETYGKIYKVRTFDDEISVLRPHGQRPGRSETHFRVLTRKLTLVIPPR